MQEKLDRSRLTRVAPALHVLGQEAKQLDGLAWP